MAAALVVVFDGPRALLLLMNETLKSALKSVPNEDAQGNAHPSRRLYACSFASGAATPAESVTSWLARCTAKPSNPSAIVEQVAHPAL